MNLLAVGRKYFGALIFIVLNLIFLLIVVFSGIFITVQQSTKYRIKMAEEAGV